MIYLCCVNLDVTKKSHLDNELVCSIVAGKKSVMKYERFLNLDTQQ